MVQRFSHGENAIAAADSVANVESITQDRYGKLLIRLEGGVYWVQTDTEKVRLRELKAKTVTIKRGALGSYIARLDGGSTIKVKRIN